jgi:hypothetical protein
MARLSYAEFYKPRPARKLPVRYIVEIEPGTENAPQCHAECPLSRECANHHSAGDFRSEDGFTPALEFDPMGKYWTCTMKETNSHGMLILKHGRYVSWGGYYGDGY